MLKRNIPSIAAVAALLFLWQLVCMVGFIPAYMLPSPTKVLQAFVDELPLLWENSIITLQLPTGVINASCFSAVKPVSGWNQWV